MWFGVEDIRQMVYTKQESDTILGTLDKGLHVLEVLSDAGGANGLTLTELSAPIGMHRTTLFRILSTLQSRGFVTRDEASGRYRLGMRVLGLASTLLRNLDIRQIARPILQRLCQRSQELVYLVVLDKNEVVTVESFDSDQVISLRADIGDRRPAHSAASGKAILAYVSDDELDRILGMGMAALTPRTITSPVVMHDHLAKVREVGFSWDDEERIEGVRCVAAPIFGADGRVVAATSIAMPTMRASWERLQDLGQEVKLAAAEISRQLGYVPE